jgi:hypothetical protein
MAGRPRHRALSARRLRAAAAIAAACLLGLLALAPAAMAGGPAQGEYSLNLPGPGGKAGASHTRIGGSGGGSALPALIVGATVLASGAAAVGYVRHRRRSGEAI